MIYVQLDKAVLGMIKLSSFIQYLMLHFVNEKGIALTLLSFMEVKRFFIKKEIMD